MYEDKRVGLENAILMDNMDVICLIMKISDDVTYFHGVDRAFIDISAFLAKEVVNESTFTDRMPMVSSNYRHIFTSQLCVYHKRLR